jgi:ubiquinone/menaquinone biosynthesis C-methylase UbiE
MDWKDPEIAKKYKPGELITGPFAAHLLTDSGFSSSIAKNDSKDFVVFDNACGTGVVAVHIYDKLPKGKSIEVVCGDTSQPMIDAVNARIGESGWKGASAKIVDAQVS